MLCKDKNNCIKKVATISRSDFFCFGHRAMSLEHLCSQLIAHSLLFLNKALYRFTIFCNDFHEVNAAVQVGYVNGQRLLTVDC